MEQIKIIGYVQQGLNREYRKLIIANSIYSINNLFEVLVRLNREFSDTLKPPTPPQPEVNYYQNHRGSGGWNIHDRGQGQVPNNGYGPSGGRGNQRATFSGACWNCGKIGHSMLRRQHTLVFGWPVGSSYPRMGK